MAGARIRSRARWVEEGEKPSHYFCSLESRNFLNKVIPRIEKENGDTISNQFDILKETKNYFKNLYRNIDDTIQNVNLEKEISDSGVYKLSDEESSLLEGCITIEEAGKILYKMKSNKSPGSDGFTSEFFKVFWKYLGIFVVRSINYGYFVNSLSITQRHGIITCLPKGDKPKHFLKNWRPISLLNTVYKIASGSIANRVKTYLDKIINPDQTGFIKGRNLAENIRTIYDIMQYTEDENIP